MRKLAILIILGAFMAPSFGHQIKSAITTVLFNHNSTNLEVMHRFYLHDAEHAVSVMGDGKADIHSNPETQQRFMDYVVQRFELQINNAPVALNNIGYEIDGKFLWIYQDTPLPEQVEKIAVQHSALQDIWSEQINTVNIEGDAEGNKAINTLTFRESAKLLEVEF
ncbi:DUF6702 family protein [Planctobacterium marinum]|uniref:Orphan protein n=1 Tax=Planctobacterium marinum TaxID=1631968 RepID=A0AA48HET3_9ALTE|nr:hypothetical protein MACH26_05670 [Planctobacterium marinum]